MRNVDQVYIQTTPTFSLVRQSPTQTIYTFTCSMDHLEGACHYTNCFPPNL